MKKFKVKKKEQFFFSMFLLCTKRLPSAFIFIPMRKIITFKRLDQKDILNVATSVSLVFPINVINVTIATNPKNITH